METILDARGIVKSFGGVHALKGVDFSLRQGEVHALVGENGAGKSTLIKIISGALQPDRGEIFYLGKPVAIDSPRKAQEMGIATVYQEPLVYHELSAMENIFLGREIRRAWGGIDWKAEEEKARALFASLDLPHHFLREPMGELSVGLQQLVLIAKALAYESRVIIFDEPTAILTEHETERLFAIIRKLRERGVGIIYISHRLEEIFRIADRVTVMRDGEIRGTFPIGEVDRNRIVELMAGKLLIETIERKKGRGETPVLSVENLTKKGRFYDISFDVFPGEILGFFGLVGSGRTDVAQTIFGIGSPDSGRVVFDGKAVRFASPEEAMRRGVVYLPEDRKVQGLFPILSVGYNISITFLKELLRSLGIVDQKEERSRAERSIHDLNIKTPNLRTKVYSLSGGNQQKVVIAKWLGTTPRVLFLDEPTRGVDVASKSEIHTLIAHLADEGLGVVIISSELPEILKLSDRIVVMHEGRITGVFEREEASSETIIRAATGERLMGVRSL